MDIIGGLIFLIFWLTRAKFRSTQRPSDQATTASSVSFCVPFTVDRRLGERFPQVFRRFADLLRNFALKSLILFRVYKFIHL
jgi:hypothetical protein